MGPAAEQVVSISMEKMGPNLGTAPCPAGGPCGSPTGTLVSSQTESLWSRPKRCQVGGKSCAWECPPEVYSRRSPQSGEEEEQKEMPGCRHEETLGPAR